MSKPFASASRLAKLAYLALAWCLSSALGWSLAFLCVYLVRGPGLAMAGLHNFVATFAFVMIVSAFMLFGMYVAHLAEIPLRKRFPKTAAYIALTLLVTPFITLGLLAAVVTLRSF